MSFFKTFSRFRIDMMFLTLDLESTQNLASYRTFRDPNNSLLVKLEFENRFWRKTWSCYSLWTERCSEKMNTTTTKMHIRKHIPYFGIRFLFLIFDIQRMNHTLCRRFRIWGQIWRSSPESRVRVSFWSKRPGPLTRGADPVRPNRTEIQTHHEILTQETQSWARNTTMGREKCTMVKFIFV